MRSLNHTLQAYLYRILLIVSDRNPNLQNMTKHVYCKTCNEIIAIQEFPSHRLKCNRRFVLAQREARSTKKVEQTKEEDDEEEDTE